MTLINAETYSSLFFHVAQVEREEVSRIAFILFSDKKNGRNKFGSTTKFVVTERSKPVQGKIRQFKNQAFGHHHFEQ